MPPFPLNRNGMLVALVSAAYAGHVGAAAGRVDFAIGGVTVAGRDGLAKPLARGAELDSGDTVRTTDSGRAQIRFTDGSYVSLQPNSDFAISEYKYDGKTDGSERGFYGLLKGAMRTVSGAIGRVNRNAYRVTTPTATVGIRGTGGVIQVLNDGSTLVIGTSGIWSLTNPAGSIDVPAGVTGLAPSQPNQPPHESTTQPTAGPVPLPPSKPAEFRQGDDLTQPVALNYVPLVTGSGYTVAAGFVTVAGGPQVSTFSNQTATFDATGRLTAFGTDNIGSGTHADFNSDGILAWGRWTGAVNVGGAITYGPNEGFHYVVGMPTATMPTSGSATYALIGASSPTYADGHTAPGVASGGVISASFIPGLVTLSLSGMTVAMPDRTYVVGGTASICGVGSSFSALGGTVSGCATTCSSSLSGFFAGASAERVGLTYKVSDGSQNVLGAAAFSK